MDLGGGAGGFGPAVPVLVQLTNGLGPGSNVILSASFTFPASSNSYQVLPFTINQNRVLQAGTYDVIVSSASLSTVGYVTWVPGQGISTQFGSVGLLYSASDHPPIYNVNLANPNNSTFTSSGVVGINNTSTADFQLTGTPVAEPSSLVLLGMGLLSLMGLSWGKGLQPRQSASQLENSHSNPANRLRTQASDTQMHYATVV